MALCLLLASAVLAAAIAAPAAAQTTPPPTIDQPLKHCYVSVAPDVREPVRIEASNFMPFAQVDVYVDDVLQPVPAGAQAPTADQSGVLSGFALAPYWPSGQRMFHLRLAEHNSDPKLRPPVEAAAKVTALAVSQSPAKSSTTAKVRFRGRGFTDLLKPIYAHYVLRDKQRATVRIGKPRYDCGQFSVRRRQFPIAKPAVGVWTIQFDQAKTYDPQTPVYTTLRVHVTRKPGS
jgi:hypothetical protein